MLILGDIKSRVLPDYFPGPCLLQEFSMAYKLDGAKFPTLDELVEALYPMYADKMSEADFRAYAEEHAEKS